jgi:hypothetical protein
MKHFRKDTPDNRPSSSANGSTRSKASPSASASPSKTTETIALPEFRITIYKTLPKKGKRKSGQTSILQQKSIFDRNLNQLYTISAEWESLPRYRVFTSESIGAGLQRAHHAEAG